MEQLQVIKTNIQKSPVRDPLGRVLFILAVIALALAPTQLTLPHLPLAPSELVLGLAAVVWVVRWISMRDSDSLPPFANWLVVIAGLCSAVSLFVDVEPAPGYLGGYAKEIAQLVLYLLVAVTVFRAILTSPRRIRIAVTALLITTSLAVLLGVVQRGLLERQYQPDAIERVVYKHFTPSAYVTIETPIEVCSTFGDWNEKGFHAGRTTYAGFLALVLPFAVAAFAGAQRRPGMKTWLVLLLCGAAFSVLAGFVMPALLLGLVATACALGKTALRFTVIAIMTYIGLVALVGGHNRVQILQEPFQLKISASEASNPNYRYDGVRHLKKFWGEQAAALSVMRGTRYVQNPALFGVGAGQYQKNIQEGYGGMSAVSNQRLESNAQSGYLLTLVGTGIFGLAALFALFGTYLRRAWHGMRKERDNPWAAAAFGAMVALVLMTLVTNPWVRGTSMVIAALFAIIDYTATKAPSARIQE